MEDARDQLFTPEQFRRNCGVGLQSKRTIVAVRSIGGDEFPETRAKRRWAPHDLLGKASQVICGLRREREQVPDLRVFRAVRL